jgi:hypothetical protein
VEHETRHRITSKFGGKFTTREVKHKKKGRRNKEDGGDEKGNDNEVRTIKGRKKSTF